MFLARSHKYARSQLLNLRLRNKQEAQEYKYFSYSNKRRRFIDANSRSVGAPRDKGKPSILAKDTSKITIINQFWLYFPTCKRLVPGAIPTLNLPEKSIPSTSTSAPRRELVKHELTPKSQYTSLDDLNRKVERLKLTGCSRTVNENNVTLVFWSGLFALPKLSVTIEATLNFTLADFNWLLPDDHAFYLAHKRSVRHATLSSLLSSYCSFSCVMDFLSSNHLFLLLLIYQVIIALRMLFDTQFLLARNTMIQIDLHSRQKYFYGLMIAMCFVMVISVKIVTKQKSVLK